MDRRYGQDYGYGQRYVNRDGQVLWFMVNGYGYGAQGLLLIVMFMIIVRGFGYG